MSDQQKTDKESFLGSLAYQIRLFFRLLFDKRVSGFIKFIFVAIPVIYFLVPMPDDLAPAIGLLDDFIFLFIFVLIFMALCPPDIKREYKEKMLNKSLATEIKIKQHPQENRELVKGFLIISLVVCLGGYLAGIVGLALYLGAYLGTRYQRLKLLANALEINDKHLPEIYNNFQEVAAIEPEAQIKLFV
ncbi:MAG: hypothetical protein NT116_05035, partial [Candidatus Parcubacteria bacterium]|nr:hypothetical protein [Candidatus Parcubacteria bacterium]